ncbi:MAG: hypothetical protein EOO27_47505, partial [Comamonadaceae bacterium]
MGVAALREHRRDRGPAQACAGGRLAGPFFLVLNHPSTERQRMQFEYSPKVQDLRKRLLAFMDEHIYPNEKRQAEEAHQSYMNAVKNGGFYTGLPLLEELKKKGRAAGLWNLFLPETGHGAGLTNLEYAPLCEIMGRRYWSAEAFNCSAPDTGNTEVIE